MQGGIGKGEGEGKGEGREGERSLGPQSLSHMTPLILIILFILRCMFIHEAKNTNKRSLPPAT